MAKTKSNLSLKRCRSRNQKKENPTKSSEAKNINLPSTKYQLNEIIKTAISPFSSSKRKYSPWKSPLSRTKASKAVKYSPLTKKPKPRPARALFESDVVSENIIETDNSASPVLCPHEFIAENPTHSNEDKKYYKKSYI